MSDIEKNITFLGCGHLGKSLVNGILNKKYNPQKIIATCRNLDNLRSLESKGVKLMNDNRAAVESSEVVVLCVRPQQVAALFDEIAPLLADRERTFISVIAGLSIADIKRRINSPVIRAMPNIASSLGQGVTIIHLSDDADKQTPQIASAIFSPSGLIIKAKNDAEVDSYTALCGSGPAYFFQFVLFLCQYGEERSLPETEVYKGVLQTMKGAVALLESTGKNPGALIDEIALPGQPTATGEALKVLSSKKMADIIAKACGTSEARAIEIGKEVGQNI